MSTTTVQPWLQRGQALFPGLIASATVAAAATFLSQHYGAPVMLFALLLGMARLLGFKTPFGALTGGAVAICGASAALAISTVLPTHERKEQATLFTVIGVSALSTLAMVAYPMVAHALGFSDHATGLFLGATIHDVAQVVGAGYGVSTEAGDTATVVKLMRVAMLMPVIVVLAAMYRNQQPAGGERPPLLPWFVVAFAALVVVGSLGWVPAVVQSTGNDASRWFLVIAISAIGLKTRMAEIVKVGIRPIALMVGETLFLAALVLVLLHYLP
jgi:uncharacterized integral membrane protein (TIGR00698 family)